MIDEFDREGDRNSNNFFENYLIITQSLYFYKKLFYFV